MRAKHELEAELRRTVDAGLEAAQLGDDKRSEDLLTKAELLHRELGDIERTAAIRGIGASIVYAASDGEPIFGDPVTAFLKSEEFERFRGDVRDGREAARTVVKAAGDVVTDSVGDKWTEFAPGITNLNYVFPLKVGSLFTQATMSGSNISYLKIPAGATGDADYQDNPGDQKGGTFAMTLDSANETAKTVAAVATIPSQNLDDINGLDGQIRSTLLVGPNGLGELLEDAYINGAGGSTEIQGILGLNPDDSTLVGEYVSKSIVKAASDINAATGFTADAAVVHPDDWFTLVTEVGTVDNRPLNTPWGGGWGVDNSALPPLVVSRKIAPGTILVGAFKASTRYVRQAVTIFADQAGLGLRDKNLVLLVAEVRELVLHRYAADPFRIVSLSS